MKPDGDPRIYAWTYKIAEVKCTENASKYESHELLKNEVDRVKKYARSMFGTDNPNLNQTLDHYFGFQSTMHQFFKNEIDTIKEYKVFLKFIHLFYSSHGMIVQALDIETNRT